MNAGDLRHRVTIQSKTDTPDGMAGFTTTWATFATVFGAIWPTSAKELILNQQLRGTVTHRVRIRYLAGVTSGMKILFGSRIFNIVGPPIDHEERHEYMDLICTEEV